MGGKEEVERKKWWTELGVGKDGPDIQKVRKLNKVCSSGGWVLGLVLIKDQMPEKQGTSRTRQE